MSELAAARGNRIHNPVISGFHPDPSICRVGADYFLVTSSFEYFPGVPIFHSRDLASFRQIGHCLTRRSQLDLWKAKSAQGVWAPTIRHHDGTFYMVTTNVGGSGNFYVTAKDPAGPWSEPIGYDHSGYDPSLFFDDDGTAYFTSVSDGGIVQSTFEPRTGKRTSEQRKLWSGSGGPYPEAPHLYKVNGYYYLLLAEGGTEYGHMATLARSHSPWGPFEPCPHNPILSHRDRAEHAFHAIGHADFVQAEDGSWWTVCLGIRPIGRYLRYHHLGRETFVAPLEWDADGWPRIGENGTVPVELVGPPAQPTNAAQTASPRDDFDQPALGLVWNYRKNPVPENYSLTERPGWLRLTGDVYGLNEEVSSPTFVGRRLQHFDCRATTLLDFEPKSDGEEAGLSVLMNPSHHYEVFVSRRKGERFVQARRNVGDLLVLSDAVAVPTGPVTLEIVADAELFRLGMRGQDGRFSTLAEGQTRYLSKEVAGGFMGAYFGLYATGNGNRTATNAYFDWFEYAPR